MFFKNQPIGQLSIEELNKQLEDVNRRIEDQERMIESTGDGGVISSNTSKNILESYQKEKREIEEAIKQLQETDIDTSPSCCRCELV